MQREGDRGVTGSQNQKKIFRMNVSNIYYLCLDYKKAEELSIKFTEDKKEALHMLGVMLNQTKGCIHQKDHASSFAARWVVMCVKRFFIQLSFDCFQRMETLGISS
jgi:hypothetical protein